MELAIIIKNLRMEFEAGKIDATTCYHAICNLIAEAHHA